MAIEYRITPDDEHDFSYRIELDRDYDQEAAAQAPKWTRLDHQRCSTARPLSDFEDFQCPPWTPASSDRGPGAARRRNGSCSGVPRARHISSRSELAGRAARSFQQLQLVNQAFWQRIHDTCHADSNLKAFLTFFSMASSLTYSLETQLQKIRPLVMSAGEGVELF